jgi:hypothetical protein
MFKALVVALAISAPPSIPLSEIGSGKILGKGDCVWRGERSTCFYVIHNNAPYALVTQKQFETLQLRYIVTLRNGKAVELWSHDSKET